MNRQGDGVAPERTENWEDILERFYEPLENEDKEDPFYDSGDKPDWPDLPAQDMETDNE